MSKLFMSQYYIDSRKQALGNNIEEYYEKEALVDLGYEYAKNFATKQVWYQYYNKSTNITIDSPVVINKKGYEYLGKYVKYTLGENNE